MNCPNCNKLLKPTQKFCPACGTRIMPQEQESNSQQTQNEQPTLQYGTTGEPVSMPSEPSFEQSPENIENSFNQEPPSAPPKKKNNIVVIIVIAGAALLLIAGGIFAAMKLFGSKDERSCRFRSVKRRGSERCCEAF